MVLFKRKPVTFLPRPSIEDDDAECWIIPETQEVFLSYESYLQRMDWYKSKRFICEISGHSGLSFFDALKSEAQGAKEVDNSFPEALKDPVLRRIQFSTTSRIDNLVDEVYDEFKHDFFPGENVTVVTQDGARETGVVRDKALFPEICNPEGVVMREGFSRYFVKLDAQANLEILVDDSNVTRDRKFFTKQILRSFIKNTVTREAWTGAPWLVKQQFAEWYRIDTNVPEHLQYRSKQAERKEKKLKREQEEDTSGAWPANKLPELKPAPKGKKGHVAREAPEGWQQPPLQSYQGVFQPDAGSNMHTWAEQNMSHIKNGLPPGQMHSAAPNGQPFAVLHPSLPMQQPILPVAPRIRYPIEDMDVPPSTEHQQRPLLNFATEAQAQSFTSEDGIIPDLQPPTIGLLLETWNTMNVYCQVLMLDSFTFDDFVDAIRFSSTEIDCELFVEIHCAVLKKLVNSESEQNGAIQISLPDLPDPEDSGDENDEEDEEEEKTPTPEPEPDVPARRTRSSLNRAALAEEKRLLEQQVKEESPPLETIQHRADEMFDEEYGWVQRLRKRDFRHGGWQLIMVGLLHQLSGRPRLENDCNKILMYLAPLDAEPTIETVLLQYSTMDVNLRALALQIIIQLFLETKTVKTFLEEMSNTMTQLRKVKIEHQRARKEAIAKLKILYEERRALAPQETTPTPPPELDDTMDIDKPEDQDMSIADSDDDGPIPSRTLRRGLDRAAERKRKRDEEAARKEKAAEAKQNKGSKEYQKVLKAIEKELAKKEECEEQIEIVDDDLREADCPRTRVLGKDRFCNRYWWFERNAMPYGGLPDSSTAEADYANGRIWVQGPDDMERLGFIDVSEEAEFNYTRAFQMTPADRKKLEEGSTNLQTAHEWGFYDKIEDVDGLIAWLDHRGARELKLKKELKLQRDIMSKYMEHRKAYLAHREPSEEPTTRISTRTKTYVSDNVPRCLKWRNTTALAEIGHKHIDSPPKPRARGRKSDTTAKSKASAVNRQGRPVTRQGTRYDF